MARTRKTNNSFLMNKVNLRLGNLPESPSVLDCFGGSGAIWKIVERQSGQAIRYIGIDKLDYGLGFYLPGDNMGYLHTMDLNRFNVIDLDAYGVPYKQLAVLFDREYRGRVFVTFIQVVVGEIPHKLLVDVGFTHEMIAACKTLFFKRGWQYFLEWLAQKGVRTIKHRSHARKHYLVFDIQ